MMFYVVHWKHFFTFVCDENLFSKPSKEINTKYNLTNHIHERFKEA